MLLKKYQQKVINETNKVIKDLSLLEKYKNNGIPTLCYKVPTGGGKTILGASSIETIYNYYYKNNKGLVIWLTPSTEIYNQTLKQLKNSDSYIRQILERMSFGRVKIFEKKDIISRNDIESGISVLVLTIQSLNRTDKEGLKYYGMNTNFINYFYNESSASQEQKNFFYNQNLNILDFDVLNDNNITQYNPVLSLANIVRFHNPMVIVDEAHKYGSKLSSETLSNLNPSFILELTATPLAKQKTFIEISGNELDEEGMIKLPIYYSSINSEQKNINWKILLSNANNKLNELSKIKPITKKDKERYLRPIMLIRVDFADEDLKKQKGKSNKIFPSDIVEYLTETLNIAREEIIVKTSKENEMINEDLMSKNSKVRYIITKDALKEGWDCPFAYILVNLTTSNQKSLTSLTQLIGRVLRQPYTEKFKDERLNSCYVFYDEIQLKTGKNKNGIEEKMSIYDIVVNELKKDGYDNFEEYIKPIEEEKNSKSLNNSGKIKQNIERRRGYEYIIKLPKLLNKDNKEFEYYRDILFNIEYDSFKINTDLLLKVGNKTVVNTEILRTNQNYIDEIDINDEIDKYSTLNMISNVIENQFVGIELFNKYKSICIQNKLNYKDIDYIMCFLNQLNDYVENQSKIIFEENIIKNYKISKDTYWELPLNYTDNIDKLKKIENKELSNSIFDYMSIMNNGEEKTLNQKKYKKNNGFWKIPEKHKLSYYIKGWNKNYKIYPDFLIVFNDNQKKEFKLLETKGSHLVGNKDTEYKIELFNLLNNKKPKGIIEIKGKEIEIPIIFELKEIE